MVNQEDSHEEIRNDKKPTINKKIKSQRQTRDKIVFTLNFILTISSAVVFFQSPLWFAYINAISITLMMIHRFYEFYCLNWQFYLVDFCYVVNTLVILYSVFYPKNYYMFMTAYAFGTGPIFTSIAYYRFAFVFHNTIKMTSHWTHYSPALTMFLIRWYDTKNEFLGGTEYFNQFSLNFDFIYQWGYNCTVLYFTWFIIYYFFIFHLCKNYIKKTNCETQYNYLITKKESRRIVMVLGKKWSEIVYMFSHAGWVYLNIILSLLHFFNFYLGVVVFSYLTITSIWNGASYYMDYFSEHYSKQFIEEERKFQTYI